jgi:7,8-dihydropterin-6-yl-methyl-4-(beta-D-ribofuranosyl)aminobenzene 5'-phosphate synthase
MLATRTAYEATGARFVEHAKPERLAPSVWVTGAIPRRHAEKNYPKGVTVLKPGGAEPDTIPEDLSVVIDARDGLIVMTGCGHAGIGNILSQARDMVPATPVKAVLGGLHVYDADDATLTWTAGQMREAGVKELVGAHCTGIESLHRLRELLGLDRKTAVVGAVGAGYSSAAGIRPGAIAQ